MLTLVAILSMVLISVSVFYFCARQRNGDDDFDFGGNVDQCAQRWLEPIKQVCEANIHPATPLPPPPGSNKDRGPAQKILQINSSIWKPSKWIYRSESPPNVFLIWNPSTCIYRSENPTNEFIVMKTLHVNLSIWKPSILIYRSKNRANDLLIWNSSRFINLKTLQNN